MLTRILTAAALLPIVAVVYFGPAWLFAVLAVAAALACVHEAARLFEAKGMRPVRPVAFAAAALVAVAFYVPGRLPVEGAIAVATALAFGVVMLLRPVEDALPDVGSTLALVLFPALAIGFQIAIRVLDGSTCDGCVMYHRSPTSLLVFLYAVVFGNDAAAYFAGRFLGRMPLAPAISPKKTVEGFLGGVAGGIALGLAFRAFLPGMDAYSWGRTALMAGVLAVAAVLGDLAKSAWKRSAGVKDSGSLLPGHGGVLDRLDGLTFAAPLLWLMVTAADRPVLN